MRSSVVDATWSPQGEGRDAQYAHEAAFQPPKSKSRRPPTHPQQRSKPRRTGPAEGWLPLFLLAIALYSVVSSIIAANWVSHSMVLLLSPAIGLVVGLIIAKLPRLPQAVLHLAACLVGHWLAIWLTSVVAFHISWLLLLGGLRAAITGTLGTGMVPTSEIIFFFYLTFLCFFLGYFGSWLVYRAHLPWLVALVYCSILLVNLNYVKLDLTYLVVILIGALILLIARVQMVAQIQYWTMEGLHTDVTWLRGLTSRCMQVASILTVVALLVGWILPIQNQSASNKALWDQLNNAWTNVIGGHASLNNLGSLTQPYQSANNFFSDQLTISGSVHLPVGEVLYYNSMDGQPHYQEGFTFNRFDGHTWTTSLIDTHSYEANASMPVDVGRSDNSSVKTIVTVVQPPDGPKHYIFGPAQPVLFDTSTLVYSDGMASAWMQQSPLTQGEHYNVVSMLPVTDATTLSQVPLPQGGSDVWQNDAYYQKLAMYLEVPQDLSSTVGNTTKLWTQGATSTYGALKMLESHLSDQATFTYSVDNTPIPNNVDVVDWLLQTRSGYCTYYATAMAVMARQLGIPTRIVNGFSQGHLDVTRHVWSVDGQDAHSWVQAYLPGFGWVNFDPTPGYAPGAAPSPSPSPVATKPPVRATPAVTPPAANTTTPPKSTPPPSKFQTPPHLAGSALLNENVLMMISIIVLLLSVLVFLAAAFSYWWRNLYAENGFAVAMFWRLCKVASWAGFSPRSWQTPYEYSGMLSNQIPHKAMPLWSLTELFVRERWGPPRSFAPKEQEETIQRLWPNLRSMLMHLLLRKVKK